ncbi:MAG: cobalt-precorrin-3B C(17)-methyltransferase, partial [Patescibacteria group bacterium]
AKRADESLVITTLEFMTNHDIDMFSTVIIGNSQSYIWHNKIITPRGYKV